MFWFFPDLERLENEVEALEYDPKLVFYGSSTFTLWSELTSVFKEYNPLNLGFGGSTVAACTWFFDRVFKNIDKLESIVVYAGDNDLGEGRHPEEVVLILENLLAKVRAKYGDVKFTCISIKPSIARKHLMGSIHFTNSKIEEFMSKDENFHYVHIYDVLLDEGGNPNIDYFEEDGLHLNKAGYKAVLKVLKTHPEIFPEKVLEEI
ncbi:GDSL-type esterase/lipase family protein [Seonamhaeicola sp. MEBiC1930]|uniref:GDSL-type esterase/lipase family protein n=1 Tax=Seonamhaeicola sp. MEBiC01930 TaxID=2976768 RepID=UPI0032458896